MDTRTWATGRKWTARLTAAGPLPAIIGLALWGEDTETVRVAISALGWIAVGGIAAYVAGASGEHIAAIRWGGKP